MSFETVVRRRAMIRAYTDAPVPEAKILRLLSYATRAPSAGNLQPWEFVIVRNRDIRARLAEASGGQKSVAGAPVVIVTCGDVERGLKQYGPRAAFFSLVDTAFASLLVLLGAVEQGLGACFVGSYDPVKVTEILGLPSHVHPVGLITIGYSAEKPRKPPNPRIPVKTLIHTDHW